MKLHTDNHILIRSALILALAVCSPVQAQGPGGRGMMKGKMMGYCREMTGQRQQMMEAFKAQDAALTEQLAKLKSAPDDKKMEQMTALVTLMAEQRIAMNAHREKMQDLMTKHMLRHMEAGKEFGIRPYGIKAMSSLSVEKSYRLVPRELSIEYNAYESGLDRFVHPNKGEFIGRDALVAAKQNGLGWNFVTMEVHGVGDGDSDARGSEPLYRNGQLIGRATNGAYGFRVNKSLALGMVRPEHSAIGTELEIKILGKLFKATVIPESPYDPDNKALRA